MTMSFSARLISAGLPGALDDDDVVFLRERIERLQNLRHKRLLSREVVPRSEGSLLLAGHDELASVAAFGLEQDGVHAHVGAIPHASACMIWARPISSPSAVTPLLSAMF